MATKKTVRKAAQKVGAKKPALIGVVPKNPVKRSPKAASKKVTKKTSSGVVITTRAEGGFSVMTVIVGSPDSRPVKSKKKIGSADAAKEGGRPKAIKRKFVKKKARGAAKSVPAKWPTLGLSKSPKKVSAKKDSTSGGGEDDTGSTGAEVKDK